MTEYQFTGSEILIQPYASNIGAFTFDLSPQLPSGRSISNVTVKSYLDGVESTTDLINTTSLSNDVVSVYFDYPGTTKHGKHKLTFQYTLDNGAKDEADFFGVSVRDA